MMTSNSPLAARLSIAIVLCLTLLTGFAPEGWARGKFAAVTVDARTGAILYSSDMDGVRHPASLTKMMTLYVLFEELKAGRVKLDTPLKVSRRASLMAPSKLGLKPGSSITVDNAIRALVIVSANDVAAVIGENLEGTEGAFATRMTQTARRLGMSKTTYRNASGLPNPGQVTTARDQATLGLRLMRDFPQYYPYFRTTSFKYGKRVIRTHNRLVGRFEGTDGIKTGYINASGYNLVTSTRRGEKRLVGVVLGGRTASLRNAYMVSMLNKQFSKARGGNTIAALAGSSKGAVNPIVAMSATKKSVVNASAEEVVTDNVKLAEAAAAAAKQPEAPRVLEANLGSEGEDEADEEIATGSTEADWSIRVGDYKNRSSAKSGLKKLLGRKELGLSQTEAVTEAIQVGGKVVYKARFNGFAEQSARNACQTIATSGSSCVVIAPGG